MLLLRNGKDYALTVVFSWDTPQDAAEFMTGLRDLRQLRGTYTGPDPNHISWAEGGRSGYAATRGNKTVLAVTTTDAAKKKLMPALGEY
jgi:hypothetical protein